MGIWAVFQANQREADTVCGQAVTFSRRRARCRDGQIDSINSTDLWIFFSAEPRRISIDLTLRLPNCETLGISFGRGTYHLDQKSFTKSGAVSLFSEKFDNSMWSNRSKCWGLYLAVFPGSILNIGWNSQNVKLRIM